MSLIYIGCGENNPGSSVEALYHNMSVKSPLWPRTRFAEGQIRYEVFVNADSQLNKIFVGVPYRNITNVRDASESFLENFSERLIGRQDEEVFQYSGQEYTLYLISEEQVSTSQEKFDGIEYSVITISNVNNKGNIAFSLELSVDKMAINVADSLFFETTWSLDVTLYGPVSPREHSFLDENTENILRVKKGYSYLYLPESSFPKTVSPEPLESFFRESENKFYYTWVVGDLTPWYEQRMMVTYGSHEGNYIAAVIAGVIASVIFLLITVFPRYVSDLLEAVGLFSLL